MNDKITGESLTGILEGGASALAGKLAPGALSGSRVVEGAERESVEGRGSFCIAERLTRVEKWNAWALTWTVIGGRGRAVAGRVTVGEGLDIY